MCLLHKLVIATALLLYFSLPAEAVIALAQDCQNATGASGTAATPTFTPTIHNAVIVMVFKDGDTGANTQTVGDTLTQRADKTGSGLRATLYTNYDVAGSPFAYTFTFTSTNWRIVVCEFSGMDTTQTTADASGGMDFTSSAPFHSVATGATTNANDLLITGWNGDGSGSTAITSTNGDDATAWTVPIGGSVITGGTMEFVVAYQVVSATGTYGCTLVLADGFAADAVLGAFKAAGGGGGATSKRGTLVGVHP